MHSVFNRKHKCNQFDLLDVRVSALHYAIMPIWPRINIITIGQLHAFGNISPRQRFAIKKSFVFGMFKRISLLFTQTDYPISIVTFS